MRTGTQPRERDRPTGTRLIGEEASGTRSTRRRAAPLEVITDMTGHGSSTLPLRNFPPQAHSYPDLILQRSTVDESETECECREQECSS